MAVLDVLLYPNATLRKACRPLEPSEIHSTEIQTLISDMLETMYHYPGCVGLAAPQVGVPVQLFVMDATSKTTRERQFVVINPSMPQQSQWKYCREGCLSFPDYLVTVKRAKKIMAQWHDASGQAQEQELKDFEAVIFQHEWDHLQGILFLDRIKNIETDLIPRIARGE